MKRTMMAGLAALGMAMAPGAVAAQTASVYAVHGIPGQALGAGVDPALPVDVSVAGGGCIAPLNGFTFGEIRGPLALPPGVYTLEIRLGNSVQPCAGAVALTKTVTVQAGKSYSVVAHLTEAGAPTVSAYLNDISRTEPGKGRILVHHTAAAPSVNITLARGGNGPVATLSNVSNPQQGNVQVRPGDYQLSIAASADPATPVFNAAVTFSPYSTSLVYAIGSLSYPGTFRLAAKVIPSR